MASQSDSIMRVLILSIMIVVVYGRLSPLHKVDEPVPGSYLVKIKDDVSLDNFLTSFSTLSTGRVVHKYEHVLHGVAVRLPSHLVDALRSLDGVEYIGEDGIAYAQQAPASWGLDRVDQPNLPLDNMFNPPNDGAGTNIYIIDSGLLHSHVDFGNRAVNLWDFESGNGGDDCDGHGTHCGGTAAGSIYGIAKGATLKSVRALGCTGSGLWADVLFGLDMVVADEPSYKVASMSIGGSSNIFVDVAIYNAVAAGVVVVVAAGNSNANACNYSPSGEPSAITVGATDIDDDRASYSNYGSCVDLFAPGTQITSAYIGSDSATATISGTSMACPHVAGAAALLLYSGVSAEDVHDTLKNTATSGVITNPGNGSPNNLLHV